MQDKKKHEFEYINIYWVSVEDCELDSLMYQSPKFGPPNLGSILGLGLLDTTLYIHNI